MIIVWGYGLVWVRFAGVGLGYGFKVVPVVVIES